MLTEKYLEYGLLIVREVVCHKAPSLYPPTARRPGRDHPAGSATRARRGCKVTASCGPSLPPKGVGSDEYICASRSRRESLRLAASPVEAIDRLLDAASDQAVTRLAERLARLMPRCEGGSTTLDGTGWLATADAAKYLGITANALNKLTAARAIDFEQSAPRGKCWFTRSALDAYRRGAHMTATSQRG
jgi:hypothetical protein